ncbi:MAG TPA: hypothetical protein VIZ28_16845 [Chitinophagaceae bacterium]
MKKILIVINIFLFGIIIFQACNSNDIKSQQADDGSTSDPVTASTKAEKTMQAKLILPGVYFLKRESLDSGLLDDSIAKVMSESYRNDISKSRIGAKSGFFKGSEDTRSIWFSLATLQSFIDNIERATRNDKCNLGLGIRIYYAKYPSSEDMAKCQSLMSLKKENVANRHTIFMVPTYYDTLKNAMVDFNYNHVDDPSHPTPYYLLIREKRKITPAILAYDKSQYKYNGPNTNVYKVIDESIQNHGGMAPPPAGEGTFPSSDQ